ncbi:hypothetical protein D9619_008636 [Psilocybe cf. subviscida]|uniref:D-lactate dehydratase n=1 Tax=Psilocybe cf. subviscida TaxID=2480587 RepID=A0A8H5B9Z9_9AGAR|nr:hypothetical protein D9619_008636 [Psilocybe cf. subviscida]
MPAVLIVLSSATHTLTGGHGGWYLPEAAHPYEILSPHYNIDFAAPKGPNPPVDEGSVKDYAKDESSMKFWNDPVVKDKLANAKKLSEVDVADYEAVFYVGGHGPMMDLAFDEDNAKVASTFWQEGKIVSAVCHGPAGLVKAVDSEGKAIFAGRTVSAFSNKEEKLFGTVDAVPFSLEDKIVSLGATFVEPDAPYGVKLVVDGKLITGANPASGAAVGKAILEALQKAK